MGTITQRQHLSLTRERREGKHAPLVDWAILVHDALRQAFEFLVAAIAYAGVGQTQISRRGIEIVGYATAAPRWVTLVKM